MNLDSNIFFLISETIVAKVFAALYFILLNDIITRIDVFHYTFPHTTDNYLLSFLNNANNNRIHGVSKKVFTLCYKISKLHNMRFKQALFPL